MGIKVAFIEPVQRSMGELLDEQERGAVDRFREPLERFVPDRISEEHLKAMADDMAVEARANVSEAILAGRLNRGWTAHISGVGWGTPGVEAYVVGGKVLADAEAMLAEESETTEGSSIQVVKNIGGQLVSRMVLPDGFFTAWSHRATHEFTEVDFYVDDRHVDHPQPKGDLYGVLNVDPANVALVQAQGGGFWIGEQAHKYLDLPEL